MLAATFFTAPLFAQDAPLEFGRDVLPILQKACFECHGPHKQRGGLRLDGRAHAIKGGDSGPALTPGKADQSELVRRIMLPKGAEGVMPDRGETLTKAQIDILRRWVNEGAVWPSDAKVATHWAYVAPKRPALPSVKKTDWPRMPIDHFILARLEREGLTPSAEADRATLLRRVSLDLIGLPPAPAEVDAFVADTAPLAYERVVERLLASPQFGERWARPWLDLARYADSHGFQKDDFRNTWPYRDWVIRALNADMPFDQFTREQIAGDLIENATLSQKIATGFHRLAPTNVEAGTEPEETRVNQIFDRINTTAAIWLGSTLECAQCHDHKYDPFTQKEYYQLFAFFNNTALEANRANPRVPGSIQFLGPYLTIPPEGKAVIHTAAADSLDVEKKIEARKKLLLQDLDAWEKKTASEVGKAGQAHVLAVSDFYSKGGSAHKVLEDQSVLLVGEPPETDTYTVTVQTKLAGITGFKLETLTHDSLPGMGPGRGDPERTNFILNDFRVTATIGEDEKPVKLVKARADYSQKGWDVSGAIDDNAKSGWAIGQQFHKPHWAVFETAAPVGSTQGATFTFTLVQNYGQARTIGRLRLSALIGAESGRALPSEIVALLNRPAAQRSAQDAKRLQEFRFEQDEELQRLLEHRDQVKGTSAASKAVTTLVMQEIAPPRPTMMFKRGDFKTPGPEVKAATPAVLHPLPDGPGNRLTLAAWLTSRNNPLAARVTVNRWWAELFGHGIVSTVEDFGIKGEAPTHPELLDWLAVEFMDNGWSMKKILKHIVLSATYRQSSKLTAALRERDDQNRLYARGPRFRMDAEMIRDNALSAAGLLSLKSFGPPVRPYQPEGLWQRIGGVRVEYVMSPGEDRYRRGVYVVWKRSVPYPSFVNFDATNRYACTVKRSRSNTPLQALTLLNDPVYVEAAMALAARVVAERKETDARLEHAFRLCLARTPRPSELQTLRHLYDAQHAASKADASQTRALFAQYPVPSQATPAEFAGWYAVAAALMNLDEMITKN
jgi:hypothetical protein